MQKRVELVFALSAAKEGTTVGLLRREIKVAEEKTEIAASRHPIAQSGFQWKEILRFDATRVLFLPENAKASGTQIW